MPENLSLHRQARNKKQSIAQQLLRGKLTTRMPTWTFTQVPPTGLSIIELLATDGSKQLSITKLWATGSHERSVNTVEGKVIFRQALMEKSTPVSWMIPRRVFTAHGARRSNHFCNLATNSICAKLGKSSHSPRFPAQHSGPSRAS